MESITTNASYASIANPSITRGRPNGIARMAIYVKGTITRATWKSGKEFNAPTNSSHGNMIIF
jgi:hypothetical protein